MDEATSEQIIWDRSFLDRSSMELPPGKIEKVTLHDEFCVKFQIKDDLFTFMYGEDQQADNPKSLFVVERQGKPDYHLTLEEFNILSSGHKYQDIQVNNDAENSFLEERHNSHLTLEISKISFTKSSHNLVAYFYNIRSECCSGRAFLSFYENDTRKFLF